MINIEFNNKSFSVKKNSNLRKVIMQNNLSPYNGLANFLNCHGLGTCGTCAVKIEGEISSKTKVEKWRLNFPPHKEESGLRLACQCKVLGNIKVTKYPGFWGEKINNQKSY